MHHQNFESFKRNKHYQQILPLNTLSLIKANNSIIRFCGMKTVPGGNLTKDEAKINRMKCF